MVVQGDTVTLPSTAATFAADVASVASGIKVIKVASTAVAVTPLAATVPACLVPVPLPLTSGYLLTAGRLPAPPAQPVLSTANPVL